jgi:hypothetical protein
MNRDFYSCVVCQPEADYCEKVFNIIINENAFVFHEEALNTGQYYNIKPGDIIIISYYRNFVAYGEAIGIKDRPDDEGWTLAVPVKSWFFLQEDDKEIGVSSYGIGWSHYGSVRDIIKRVEPQFAMGKIKEINSTSTLYQQLLLEQKSTKNNMEIQKQSISSSIKNKLFYKALPVQGKTRLAEILANRLTVEKNLGSPLQLIDDFLKVLMLPLKK